jgi:adenylate cyclase, class 2
MGYEVEIKFRVRDHEDLRRRLAAMGASAEPEITQEDTYFAHPSRDFAHTDEALRVRQAGSRNWVTYKGPKHGGPTKTREELDVPFAEGGEHHASLCVVFKKLGFKPVMVVRKTRTPYHLSAHGRALEIGLDLSSDLGAFAEVETLAADASDLPSAQQAVLAAAADLGLTDVEPRSYLRMTLERGAN